MQQRSMRRIVLSDDEAEPSEASSPESSPVPGNASSSGSDSDDDATPSRLLQTGQTPQHAGVQNAFQPQPLSARKIRAEPVAARSPLVARQESELPFGRGRAPGGPFLNKKAPLLANSPLKVHTDTRREKLGHNPLPPALRRDIRPSLANGTAQRPGSTASTSDAKPTSASATTSVHDNPTSPMPVTSSRWGRRLDLSNFRGGGEPEPMSSPAGRAAGSPVKIQVPTTPQHRRWQVNLPRPTSPQKGYFSPKSNVFRDSYIDPAKTQESIINLFEGAFDHAKELGDEDDANADAAASVSGVNVRLMKHQVQGLRFLERREEDKKGECHGGILADDMGLGKTVQILSLISKRRSSDAACRATLVVAPLALIRQWESEIQQKTNMTCYVYHGPNRVQDSKKLASYDVVVTTYNVITSEWKGDGENASTGLYSVKWWRVVLDEAQSIKNKNSKSAQGCCGLSSVNRWCLSGTPLQNNVDELYSLIRFLRIAPMDDYSVWRSKITTPVSNGQGELAIERLQTLLSVIMIRRTKAVLSKQTGNADMLSLPSRHVYNVTLDFSPEERGMYNRLALQLGSRLQDMMDSGSLGSKYTNVLCLLLRLRQACCHPNLITSTLSQEGEALSIGSNATRHDQEVDALADALGGVNIEKKVPKCQGCFKDLAAGASETHCPDCKQVPKLMNQPGQPTRAGTKISEMLKILLSPGDDTDEEKEPMLPPRKTIVFSQFTSMLTLVEPVLQQHGIKYVRYDGSMSNRAREEALNRLRTDAETRVLLCSLKCGALGLNLTVASRVVLLDLWWNPAIEEQAIDRVHRIGQMRPVLVYRLVVRDTVEERILALQDKKRQLASGALGDKNKALMNKLSLDDIAYLFRRDVY